MTTSTDLLNDQYAGLIGKISAFINGPASGTVQTTSGSIKTLAGLAQDVSTLRYSQKISDINTLANAINTLLPVMSEGDLVRIWGDVVGVNGIYQCESGALVKISYSDLYDLRDLNPKTGAHVTADETTTTRVIPVATFTLPVSATSVSNLVLRGHIAYRSKQTSYRGSYAADFTMNVIGGDESEAVAVVVLSNKAIVGLDSAWDLVGDPTLSISAVSDLVNHNFTVSFAAPLDVNSLRIPGALDLVFGGVDLDLVNFQVGSVESWSVPTPLAVTTPDLNAIYDAGSDTIAPTNLSDVYQSNAS